MIHNIPQPTFEEFVRDHLSSEDVTIITNASFVSCRQDDAHVYTIVEDRYAGGTFEVCSQHVIACDGARSHVRSSLGIECDGEDSCKSSKSADRISDTDVCRRNDDDHTFQC